MISVHFTIYTDEQGRDRFAASAPDPEDPDNIRDVTEQYELAAATTDKGRPGFAFFRREPWDPRHPTGAEL